MNYKNGRQAKDGDPVIGTMPNGKTACGVIYGVENSENAFITVAIPGRVISRNVVIRDLFHVEDALAACEFREEKINEGIFGKPEPDEDDLRILHDSRLDKEAREIFPSRKTPNPKALESLGATSEKSGGIFTEQNTGTKSDWISVNDRLPADGQLVIAKRVGFYEDREVVFRSFGSGGWFGDPSSKDGKGAQLASHWRPATIADDPRWKYFNKVETECYPLTQCCAYAASTTGPHPVRWNPGNNVIQCHNCGCVYSSAAFLSANAKPKQEGPKTK